MILPIYIYGQPVLRKEAQTVVSDYQGLKELIANMFETMYSADGVGLAAPQIGQSIQLFVVDADAIANKHPECKKFKRVIINPVITEQSDETISLDEGCLSFPGIHEKVTRSRKITIKYSDENFVEREECLDGYTARIVQHEYDHLCGEMFIDNISPIRRQLNRGKLNNLLKGDFSCDYKIKLIKR